MRNKLGNICIVLGIVLVFSALSLFTYHAGEEKKAAMTAEQVIPEVLAQIQDVAIQERERELEQTPEETKPSEIRDMTVVEIDGYGYFGYLTIPILSLELPVLSEWNEADLEISVCRFSGSVYTSNLVIAGHNYQHQFGKLLKIQTGERVILTDMDGIERYYVVELVEELSSSDVEELIAGDYALTLFTCTYGGHDRIAVRCCEVPEPEN